MMIILMKKLRYVTLNQKLLLEMRKFILNCFLWLKVEYVNNNKEFVLNDLKEYLLIDKTNDNNCINDADVLLDFDF